MSAGALSKIIHSLIPSDAEELSIFQRLINTAARLTVDASQAGRAGIEFLQSFRQLPSETQEEFYRLVEAVEIYQHIHGEVPVQNLQLGDALFQELRQIRDMCSGRSFRAIF